MEFTELDNWVGSKAVKQALVHKSYNKTENSDKLELLGDSILSERVLRLLMDMFPFADVGKLNDWKQKIVCNKNLRFVAEIIGVKKYIQYKGQLSEKMLADAVESIIAELDIKSMEKDRDLLVKMVIYKGLEL